MKKLGCFLLIGMLTIPVVHCQKFQYGGLQQVGLMFSETNVRPSFNLINGVRFNRFFIGIGVDAQLNGPFFFSYYYSGNPYNSSAVYLDERYYINKKKNFFAVIDVGVNLINQRLFSSEKEKYKKLVGYYGAIGIGFKARLGKEVFYSFDVSYNLKQTRFNHTYFNFLKEWQTDKYDFRQSLILVRMGIEMF